MRAKTKWIFNATVSLAIALGLFGSYGWVSGQVKPPLKPPLKVKAPDRNAPKVGWKPIQMPGPLPAPAPGPLPGQHTLVAEFMDQGDPNNTFQGGRWLQSGPGATVNCPAACTIEFQPTVVLQSIVANQVWVCGQVDGAFIADFNCDYYTPLPANNDYGVVIRDFFTTATAGNHNVNTFISIANPTWWYWEVSTYRVFSP